MSAFQRNLIFVVVATAIIAGGITACVGLRVGVANSDPLWLDELHSVWAVDREIFQVQQAAADGNQAPLYFWLLHFAHQPHPDSPMGYRWLSIVCGTLAAGSAGFAVYYWSKSIAGATLTVWTTAIDPQLIFYGSEARPYSMLMLLAIWQFFLFAKWEIINQDPAGPDPKWNQSTTGSNWSSWLLLGILTAAMLLVHYTGVLLILAEIIMAISLRLLRGKSRSNWLTSTGVLIVSTGVTLAIQFGTVTSIFDIRTQWSSISSIETLIAQYQQSLIYLGILPLGILFLFNRANSSPESKPRTLTICVLAWAITPALLAGVFDWAGLAPLAIYRYTVTGAVAFPILAGLGIGMINHRSAQGIVALLVLAASIFGPHPYFSDGGKIKIRYANEFVIQESPKLFTGHPVRMRNESWDAVGNLINGSKSPVFLFANLLEDQILAEPGESQPFVVDEHVLDYLKFPLSHSGKIPADRIYPRPSHAGAALCDTDLEFASQSKNCWLVIRGDAKMVARITNELTEHPQLAHQRHAIHPYHFTKDEGVAEWLTVLHVTWPEQPPLSTEVDGLPVSQ